MLNPYPPGMVGGDPRQNLIQMLMEQLGMEDPESSLQHRQGYRPRRNFLETLAPFPQITMPPEVPATMPLYGAPQVNYAAHQPWSPPVGGGGGGAPAPGPAPAAPFVQNPSTYMAPPGRVGALPARRLMGGRKFRRYG